MILNKWLNRPYPLVERQRDKLLLVVGFSLFTWLFLLLYRPFGANEIRAVRPLFLAGFGLCVGVALTINYFLLPRILPRTFRSGRWRIGSEVLYILFSFALIGGLNYLYNSTVGAGIAPQWNVLQFMGITLSVGIFPLVIMVFLIEMFLNRQNSEAALVLTGQMAAATPRNDSLQLVIEPEGARAESLAMAVADFIYAESANNYTTVYFWANGVLDRQLLRLSLKKLEGQLAMHPDLVRCHRSFIVNKRRILEFKGNARALNLVLEGTGHTVPVSRSFPREQLL
ncbi:MAG: LytTR family DNA-binding domain-containing protein [Bacteroidota bacterium]